MGPLCTRTILVCHVEFGKVEFSPPAYLLYSLIVSWTELEIVVSVAI